MHIFFCLEILIFDRQISGSHETALETVLVLRQLVSKARFTNINELVSIIKETGRRLVEAQPKGKYSVYCCPLLNQNLWRYIFRIRSWKHC